MKTPNKQDLQQNLIGEEILSYNQSQVIKQVKKKHRNKLIL